MLRHNFGKNKQIPKKYEEEILVALSHYPGLKETSINFMLAAHASVPYGTKPTFLSCFRGSKKRNYTTTILEDAPYPESAALMKNLSFNMRVGVFGHELFHVVQYEKCNPSRLIRTLAGFAFAAFRRKMETGADLGAISHGLGPQLLEHAKYIRRIPGYIEKRPNLNKDYLLPEQIEFYLSRPDKLKAA